MGTGAVAPDSLERFRRAARASFLTKADVDVPDETLAELPRIKSAFAASARDSLARLAGDVLGSPPTAVEFLEGQGTFHAVFRLEVAAEVFYARTSLPAFPVPALDFVVDAWASRSLGRFGVPTPRVRHVDVTRATVPFDLELVEAAAGEPLQPGPATLGVEALGAVAARVHAVAGEGFGPLDPGSLEGDGAPRGLQPSWRDFVMLRLEDHLEACGSAGVLSASELERVRAAFARARPVLDGAPSRAAARRPRQPQRLPP